MSRAQNRSVPSSNSVVVASRGVQGVTFGEIELRFPLPKESHIVCLTKLLTKYLFNFFGTSRIYSRFEESFRLSLFNGMVFTLGLEIRIRGVKVVV